MIASAFLDSLFKFGKSKSNPNVLCMMEHCRSQATACLRDSSCRDNMICMTKCGLTNHSCMYRCMNTYDDAVFDNMMKCMVGDHHCMELEPPDPSFRCSPPAQVLKNFTLSQLKGTWYIVRGLNPDYDCFDCAISTYSPVPNSHNYTLSAKYDVVMLNGSIRHRVAVQQTQQRNSSIGGLLENTDTLMGLTMYEKWQVLDYSPTGSYMVSYYCGHMSSNWWYEGSLVYSRTPTLGTADLARVSKIISDYMGRSIDKFCSPKTTSCTERNTSGSH